MFRLHRPIGDLNPENFVRHLRTKRIASKTNNTGAFRQSSAAILRKAFCLNRSDAIPPNPIRQKNKKKKIFPGPPGFRQHRNQIRTLVIAADVSSAFSPLFEDFATVSDLEKSASKKPTLNQTTGRQIREPAKTRSWMKKVQRKIPKKPKKYTFTASDPRGLPAAPRRLGNSGSDERL